MILTEENRNTRWKSVPVPLFTTHLSHALARNWTQVSAVRGRRLSELWQGLQIIIKFQFLPHREHLISIRRIKSLNAVQANNVCLLHIHTKHTNTCPLFSVKPGGISAIKATYCDIHGLATLWNFGHILHAWFVIPCMTSIWISRWNASWPWPFSLGDTRTRN